MTKPDSPTQEVSSPENLYTPAFWTLCTSSVLFMMSFSMILPELPEYLTSMGGEQYIGFIVGLFTVSAGLSRFWSGRLAERSGRVKVMLFGTIISMVCGFLYPFAVTIYLFLALRLLHGLSTGWRPIGATAYLADIAPSGKIGEAMGYLGIAGSTGMALGPAIGSFIKEEASFNAMFITAGVVGLVSFLMTLRLPESLVKSRTPKWQDFNIFKGRSLNWQAWQPSVVTLFDTYAFGVVITMYPILVDHLGFKYKGLFQLVIVVSSIGMRFIAGKASDRRGRLPVLVWGMICVSIAMFIMGFSETAAHALFGAVIYGIAIGINRPTIFAWTADTARPGEVA
ncbi:MAG: MFS transporter, partial [Flavobacteriales bacterium]|nr:MFS transporter [Flavobacteriales bacterium]